MWEDEANKNGGRWVLKLKEGYANRFWEETVLALIGEQMEGLGDEISGIDVAVKQNKNHSLSIWHKTASNEAHKHKVQDEFKKALQLPDKVNVYYDDFTVMNNPKEAEGPPRWQKDPQQRGGGGGGGRGRGGRGGDRDRGRGRGGIQQQVAKDE